MVHFSFLDNEIVSSPLVIVSGNTKIGQGSIQFTNNGNRVFPPQVFEINEGQFKAMLHVSEGENRFEVEVFENGFVDQLGFAGFNGKPQKSETGTLTLNYKQLKNKPVHLCLILGKDSDGSYDLPSYKRQRGEQANLNTAIRRLKVAARMMQAFTQDEMRRVGFSNRSFQFVEETVSHQGIFGYNVESPVPHQEVKVHVLRSPKSMADLRDPNIAQQNPKGTNTGELFGHANHLVMNTPEMFQWYKDNDTPIQAACIYLDSHYDAKMDMILTHAALGGGTGQVKLAIFGSHGLHSWPINFAQITPSFLDATHLGKDVANDCGECGTSWECCNVTMGAFMHEIGHSFGSPHQESGVMLRDYVWWNRSFMTREFESLKRKTRGEAIKRDGTWSKSCHWHDTDLMRYFYHDSFSIPVDEQDSGFCKVFTTTMRPNSSYLECGGAPSSYLTQNNGTMVLCESGVFMVEICSDDLARVHHDYYSKSYGGNGLKHEIMLDYDECYRELKSRKHDASEKFDVRILSVAGDLYILDFKKHCSSRDNVIKGEFGRGQGTLTGYRGQLLGNAKDHPEQVVGLDLNRIEKIQIFSGGALDGITFFFRSDGNAAVPPVPPRNYGKLLQKFKDHTITPKKSYTDMQPVHIGNDKKEYSEFVLQPDERVVKFHVRNGAWIDGIQIETNKRKSPFYGNASGGHMTTLEVPHGFEIIGMYGYVGSWLDGLGIIYK